ncbi:WRKY DNA-binding transcription factor 70 [Malania oleifera]|uniref:WRKY DNA-binding transcription factor 70 n=1 Tax=Malania oleifera TaxID=397392 RepID=UPI0025AEAEE9|nr:WRKY DNA-binding transcription factor 70 [Malania oleifera]
MESPGSFLAVRKRAMKELLRGQRFTEELQHLLRTPPGQGGLPAPSAEDLVKKICRSFSDSLLFLSSGESEEVSQQVPKNYACLDSSSADGRKYEESGESWKGLTLKDRRGCYKRRKSSTQTWTKTISTPVDDGHAWRKYGQKVILNAKHPRNYYRCTHKFDQGCQATKQVQQIEDNPSVYQITYNGHHTCKNPHKTPQIILDATTIPPPFNDSSVLLSFDQSSNSQNDPSYSSYQPFFLSSFSQTLVKQEHKDHDTTITKPITTTTTTTTTTTNHDDDDDDHHHHHHHDLSTHINQSADYLLSPDLAAFGSSGLLSSSGHNSGVNSCTTSSHSLDMDMDMDMMVGSVEFSTDDVLQFEF